MIKQSLAIATAWGVSALASAGTVEVLNENFESASGFTTSAAFFSDNSNDYFGISGGASDFFVGSFSNTDVKNYTGFSGGFLTGEDLDGEGAGLPITVTWSGLDISGLTDLTFSGLFAEFFDSPGDIDALDSFVIESRIDNGDFETVLEFEGVNFTSSGQFNGNFGAADTGDQLGSAATLFTRSIVGTGSLLDLRISIDLNAGDEDFAIDDIIITGTRAIPLPGGAALAFAGLLGVAGTRRRVL